MAKLNIQTKIWPRDFGFIIINLDNEVFNEVFNVDKSTFLLLA